MYKFFNGLQISKNNNSKIKFKGIGLHSGEKTEITILPSEKIEGIRFIRVDLKENNVVDANYLNVKSAKLCTTLENNHVSKSFNS